MPTNKLVALPVTEEANHRIDITVDSFPIAISGAVSSCEPMSLVPVVTKPSDVVTPSNVSQIENLVLSDTFFTPGRKLGAVGDGSSGLLPKVLQGAEEGIPTKTKIIKVTTKN